MTGALIITFHGIVAVLCWSIVGAGAAFAIYSRRIRDTTFERFGLALVALSAFATVCRIIRAGYVSEGGLVMAASLALYVIAIFCKHLRHLPPTLPRDKTQPGELR